MATDTAPSEDRNYFRSLLPVHACGKCTLQKFIYIQKRGTVALLKVCIGRRMQRVKAVVNIRTVTVDSLLR